MRGIVLASRSSAREHLLRQTGIRFKVTPSTIPEDGIGPASEEQIKNLALTKARDVASRIKNSIVIGADTVIIHRRKMIGKPRNSTEARKILKRLNGSVHCVVTGIAVVDATTGKEATACVKTSVEMKRMSEHEIEAYVATGEPLGKAGAYGVQGKGAIFIKRINGCYYNVVGLPLPKLADMLRKFQISLIQ
jgi:septum formation protein